MAKKRETRLVKTIRKNLRSEFHCWFFKVHGGPLQQSGIPDLVGCVGGLFFGLEVKMPGTGKVSPIQEETMSDISKEGGGYCCVVTSSKQAIRFITRVLSEEGRLREATKAVTRKGSPLRRAAKTLRTSIQAKAREDIHRRRSDRKARS